MARLPQWRSRAFNRPSDVARCVTLAALLGGAGASATAQRDPDGSEEGTAWGLGVGVIAKQDAYKGIKRETQVVPVLRFENEYVEFFGLGLEVKLPGLRLSERSGIKFGLVGKADLSGYEAKDAPILAGMAERKFALWAGANAKWENELVDVSTEWTADASGHSKGRRFSLGLKKQWHLGNHTMVMPYVTAHWVDKKYVNYYYGVRDAEATGGRAAYAGKSGVNMDIGMRTYYRFDEHHSVLLDVGITRLAKTIKASPLVDRSRTNQVILGYVYNF